MEDIFLEMAAGAVSEHIGGPIKREDLQVLEELKGMANDLFAAKSKDDFWISSGILRQKKEFVNSIKNVIVNYKCYDDRRLHHAAQCILRIIFEKVLVFRCQLLHSDVDGAELGDLSYEETAPPTVDAAHRYFLGYILYSLGKKFGHHHFRKFVLEGDLRCEETEGMWWTAGVNRGGLMFCGDDFYLFFKVVLDIEDRFFSEAKKGTRDLVVEIMSSSKLREDWVRLPWEEKGADEGLKERILKEAVRLHVGGRSRIFVKLVKERQKAAKRLCASKKPLRQQLAAKK